MAVVSPDILEGLVPLRELGRDTLEILAGEAEMEEYPAKTIVFRKGDSDEWTRYLISGQLALIREPGEQRNLIALGDSAAVAEPLGMQNPHPETAVSRTEVRLIRLPRERIVELVRDSQLPRIEVDEVDANDGEAAERLFYQLFQDLMEDKLALPSMPDIAVRVRQAISDPNATAPMVAKIIQADPVVAARLMKAANSAIYSGQRSVDSLTAAIVRLGLKNVRELVVAVTMREVFKTRSPLLNKRMVELWMHSTLVAAIAAVLAKRIKGFSADRALLAGLVHDIGVVPMLAHAGSYEELARDPAVLENAIGEYRGQIGAMILRRWNFPEDLIQVPIDAEQWTRERDESADYADLIIVAQLHSYADSPVADDYPSLTEISAVRRLGLEDQVAADSSPILDEAREEIAEVQRFLIG